MPILGIWASSISGAVADPGAFVPIATTTVPSAGAASVTFSSIPSTYTHLQIRFIARTNRAAVGDYIECNLNSDTSSSYSWHSLGGDGASPFAVAGANGTFLNVERIAGNNATAGVFGAGIIDILDYQNTNKYKTSRSLSAFDNNGSGELQFMSGNWRSTSAVSTITLTPGIGTSFNQYSSFTLFGIKG